MQKSSFFLPILNLALLALAFFAGMYVQHFLLFPPQAAKTTAASPTPAPPQITNTTIKNAAQQAFTKFLDYLVSTGTPDMHILSYKIQTLDSIYTKDNEVHAVFTFDALPKDTASSQKLVAGGGTLQKSGTITGNKGYIVLTDQNGGYAIKVISFSPPANF